MWMNLAFGLPYLVAVLAGVAVCLLAGPRGPGSRAWRVPGAVGFGLLALQHLVQVVQTVMLYTGYGPGAMYRSGLYAVTGLVGAVLTVVGVALIAAAVVRGRAAVVPAPLGGWGEPSGPMPASQGPPPAVTPQNPYGQRSHPEQGPSAQPPPTAATENPKQP